MLCGCVDEMCVQEAHREIEREIEALPRCVWHDATAVRAVAKVISVN